MDKLFKIILKRDIPFWFLGPIRLDQSNKSSEFISLDTVSDDDKDTIQNALRANQVIITDPVGRKFKDINKLSMFTNEYSISTEDVDDVEAEMPEVISVTIEEEPEEQEEISFSNEDIENAEAFLGKNANTVKAMIKKQKGNTKYLQCLLLVEEDNKDRKGIVSLLLNLLGD